MAEAPDLTSDLPHRERLRFARLKHGVARGRSRPEAEAIEQELRSAAAAIAGVTEARVALTVAEPARKLIAIGSGKGGVGRSTVAANLAVALAKAGKKVGLVAADVYGPSQPTLLGSAEKPTAEDDR